MPTDAAIKLTVFYRLFDQGWTETYYSNGSTATFAAQQVTALRVPNFLAFRANGVLLQAVRAVELTGERATFLNKINYTFPPDPQSDPDVTAVALNMTLFGAGAGGAKRQMWLRGLPDIETIRDQFGNPTYPSWLMTRVDQWLAMLIDMQWGLRFKTRSTAAPNQYRHVVSVVPSAANPNQSLVRLDSVTGLSVGDTIYFRKVPSLDLPGMTGNFVIVEIAGNVVTVPYRYRAANSQGVTPAFMLARRVQMEFAQFSSTKAYNGLRTHDTGRPTGTPRGRQRRRVSRY
jgi:hypothetical protein